ncbi:MAG TPA: hypothetical protein VLG38_05965 [Gammaproteobacteria bacterium]|nr:hypothetical protein [Gammaproteobacteria bacterium]
MKKLSTLCCLLVCLIPNITFADCDSTAKTHYPTIMQPNYQGSAHTDSFDCAVNGSKQLTLEQMNDRADLMPPNLNNRWYFRLGANAAAEGISNVNNVLPNNTITSAMGTLQNTSVKVASNNFELALGYTWSEFAIDLEWLASKAVNYSSSMYNISPTFTVNSNVKGDALLFNIYWIFQDLYNVKVYTDFIIGYSNNSSVTYIDNGPETSFKKHHWAFGLGIGGRFNIVSRLYADLSGRYIYLGTARLTATNGTEYVWLKANRTWMGAAVCLLWLF